ncbi:MAG TPA: hypothetical protein V6D18_15635 [Thermosynechococcaceae cyanobacterium]
MAERMRNYNLTSAEAKYEDHAINLDKEVSLIRDVILHGSATQQTAAEAEGD